MSDINQLEEVQSAVERTRTIDVMRRTVAVGSDGNYTEVGVPAKVFVRPLPFKRWPVVSRHIANIIAALPERDIDFSSPGVLAAVIIDLLGAAHDDVMGILTLATDKPAEFFDEIDLDEGVQVIKSVVEVNKDFFVQKVLPLLVELMPTVKNNIKEMFGETV